MKKIYNNIILLLLVVFFIIFFWNYREITFNDIKPVKIKRIVSLSPSISRQVIDLGLEDLLVGVTSYHPPLKKKVQIIGTITHPNIEKIILLKPDIVMSSIGDNRSKSIEMLKSLKIPAKLFKKSDSFETICNNYKELGALLGVQNIAYKNLKRYKNNLEEIITQNINTPNIVLLVSHKPIIGVSNISYIGKILQHAGARNSLGLLKQPYPLISIEHLIKIDPDIIISVMIMAVKTHEFIDNLIQKFPALKISKRKSFYRIDPDSVCYYTPGDYVLSVKQISQIIKAEKNNNE